jgi:photosystem II stability/assembly factor-like uncharacterized protein
MFMKTIVILFVLILLNVRIQDVQAQAENKPMQSEKLTFQSMKTSFYDFWKGKKITKGQGYKQFKRWEWFWESRLLPNGEFPSPTINIDEYQKYYASHSSKNSLRPLSSDNWEFKGPAISPGGYYGLGRLDCIAFHPTNKQIFWVGSPSGGLWKTTDGGSTWATNTDGLPVLGVSDIAIDPTNTNIMYIATGDGDVIYSNGSRSIGVLKSRDGGSTWSGTGLSHTVAEKKFIRRLLIHPKNPQILLAASSDGLWMTSNGGKAWTNQQPGYFIDVEFHPTDPSIVYASTVYLTSDTLAQIYRSTNSGSSWTSVASLEDVGRIELAVTKHSPNVVQALCANLSWGLAGIWTSSNSGASFIETFKGTPTTNLLCSEYDATGQGGQGWWGLALGINPYNDNEMWVGGINTWKSIDGAQTWGLNSFWAPEMERNPNQVQLVHADKHFFAYHPLDSGVLFECNDGGLYKTTNSGKDWIDLSNGLGISQIYRIGVSQTVENNVICGLQDNGSKLIDSNVWVEATGGDGMNCIIDYTNENIIYTSAQNGMIYRTDNEQDTQEMISINIPAGQEENTSPSGAWITPYVIHPTNPNVLLAGYKKVYKTTDQGDSWSAISPELTSDNLRFITIAPSDANTIYASTFDSLYSTSDGGINWQYIPIGIPQADISCIAVDPANPKKIFITISGYIVGSKVFVSPDGGQNWYNYSGSLPNVPANCITYLKGSNEGLYIGTDIGVFYTDASMTDWVPYQNGLPSVIVNDLEISYNDNKLWAGTYGRGLWKTDLYTGAVGIETQNINKEIYIFPNPNIGKFSVQVPDNKQYDVAVCNIHGEVVFEQRQIHSSQNAIELNDVKPGVYFVRLTIDNTTISRKIIINK